MINSFLLFHHQSAVLPGNGRILAHQSEEFQTGLTLLSQYHFLMLDSFLQLASPLHGKREAVESQSELGRFFLAQLMDALQFIHNPISK